MGGHEAAGVQGEGSGDDYFFELWGERGGDEMLGRGDGGGVFGWLDLAVEDGYWCLIFLLGLFCFGDLAMDFWNNVSVQLGF